MFVEPGVYVENIDFKGQAIQVVALEGPANTVIVGGGAGPVVTFHSGETGTSRRKCPWTIISKG